MARQRKVLLLWGVIIASFALVNGISLSYVLTNPPSVTLPPRTPAAYGSVPITPGNNENLGYIDDGTVCIAWFLHVTDIHFSNNQEHGIRYGQFLNFTYDRIHPLSVIVTGDLLSGSQPENYVDMTGRPQEELEYYYSIVNATPYATDPNPYRYVETTGNHDRNSDWGAQVFLNTTLAGHRLGSIQNFFRVNFSIGDTLFSCLDSGGPMEAPPVPFGSEGDLDATDLSEYTSFLTAHPDAEHKFTFHHHNPVGTWGFSTNTPSGLPQNELCLSNEYQIDGVFFGHSHFDFVETWGDVPLIMGDRLRDEYTDDETGLNTQFYYHLVAIDGGGVNYANVPYSRLPNVVITNPSNPVFLGPGDSIINTRGDGHVRALVFSNSSDPVSSVDYQLDGGAWKSMGLYSGSQVLYESPRATPAIPDDGASHTVNIRVITSGGIEVMQAAEVAYTPRRIWVWQGIFLGLFLIIASIVVVCNRDNMPLMRADGRRRRLSHAEKVQKRVTMNQQRNRPWWLPILGWTVVLGYLFMPWGFFPMIHGAFAAVYALAIVTPISVLSMIEPFLYSLALLLLIFPVLYHGIRKYRPNLVSIGALLLFASAGLMTYMAWDGYKVLGLILPEVYLDIIIGLVIFIGTFKHTRGFRLLSRIFHRRKASITA